MNVLHRESERLRRERGTCRDDVDETVDRSAPSMNSGKKQKEVERVGA
jgi:hypothetical protein